MSEPMKLNAYYLVRRDGKSPVIGPLARRKEARELKSELGNDVYRIAQTSFSSFVR